jgi:hypothetical protein
VGIGITDPQQKLDVNGNINVAEGSGFILEIKECFMHLALMLVFFPTLLLDHLQGIMMEEFITPVLDMLR